MSDRVQETTPPTFRERLSGAKWNTVDILKKVWLYIIIAIGIGGFIHGYVPQDFSPIMRERGTPLPSGCGRNRRTLVF